MICHVQQPRGRGTAQGLDLERFPSGIALNPDSHHLAEPGSRKVSMVGTDTNSLLRIRLDLDEPAYTVGHWGGIIGAA